MDQIAPEITPVVWTPNRAEILPPWNVPGYGTAIMRGLLCKCPSCGQGHMFKGYLRVVDACENCAAPLGSAAADDAPPYFTIFVVGHIIIPLMFMVERAYTPPLWVHAAIWLPLTTILTLALLRPIKGGTVGLMLKLGLMKSADDMDA